MTQRINPIFNQHLIGIRPIPKAPDDLADRIIAAAQETAAQGGVFMLLLIPRPFVIMCALFIISFALGFGLDMGFNSEISLVMTEQDILYSFEGDAL